MGFRGGIGSISGTGGGSGGAGAAALPLTLLADQDYASIIVPVPTDKTFSLQAAGVQNDNQNSPQNLKVEVVDAAQNTVEFTSDAKYDEGSPLYEVDGQIDLELRMVNETGAQQSSSAVFDYKVE